MNMMNTTNSLKKVTLILGGFQIGAIEIDNLPSSSSSLSIGGTNGKFKKAPSTMHDLSSSTSASSVSVNAPVHIPVHIPVPLDENIHKTFDDIDLLDLDTSSQWSSKDDEILQAAVLKIGLQDKALWKKVSKSWFHERKFDFECEHRWEELRELNNDNGSIHKKAVKKSTSSAKSTKCGGNKNGKGKQLKKKAKSKTSKSKAAIPTSTSTSTSTSSNNNNQSKTQRKRNETKLSLEQTAPPNIYHNRQNCTTTTNQAVSYHYNVASSTSSPTQRKNPLDLSTTRLNPKIIAHQQGVTNIKHTNGNNTESNQISPTTNSGSTCIMTNDDPAVKTPDDKFDQRELSLSEFLSPPLKRPFPCFEVSSPIIRWHVPRKKTNYPSSGINGGSSGFNGGGKTGPGVSGGGNTGPGVSGTTYYHQHHHHQQLPGQHRPS